jgi:hypothetical protein
MNDRDAGEPRDPRLGGEGKPGERGGRGGVGGVGGVGGRGGDPSGTGGPGGPGGIGGAIEGIQGIRRVALWAVAGTVALVALLSITVVTFGRQQARMADAQATIVETQVALEVEQSERAAAVCESIVQGRAGQLVSAEVLILAAASDDATETAAERQRNIERFRGYQEQVHLSTLPATCEGIMSLAEFQRQTRATVDEKLADLPHQP